MIQMLLRELAKDAEELLAIPMKDAFPPRIDLSLHSSAETGPHIYEYHRLADYVELRKKLTKSPVVWGGYLEHRLIYNSSPLFHLENHPRNIHLGLDFWANVGTAVFAPIAGEVHSLQDNAAYRDYGPTIILRHTAGQHVFHTLYGHLSQASLAGLKPGMRIEAGQQIGWLGDVHENGEWPPHLHFQIICDMQGKEGDYPGVCALQELEFYKSNCPDPRFLLNI